MTAAARKIWRKETLDGVCHWWLNRREREMNRLLEQHTGMPAAELTRHNELWDSVLRGTLAARRLQEEFPEQADLDLAAVEQMADAIDGLADQDQFERSVALDIALLPETRS